ncbi:hypothetical protein C8R43DRAFT_889607 [Mycena crocata]|nr:hypothetical protein C8R43DRAFT_889607 [Mycena crocata]
MRGLPPLYGRFTAAEDALPQHAGEVAPGVKAPGNGYLWIGNHAYGAGWGNALQELLLNAELAFRANRAFVFDNYTWDRDGPPYTLYGADEAAGKAGKLIPARVPLSAMIGGPLVGAPFPPSSSNSSSQPHPRAVSRTHFERVCPRPILLDPAVIKAPLDSASLPDTITAWLVALAPLGPCVQIARDGPQVFDIWLLGTAARVLPYWPALATSPILTAFRWAPLVRAALGDGSRALAGYNRAAGAGHRKSRHPEDAPLPGLLALHVRRGDFGEHCTTLAKWSAGFNALNSFAGWRGQERFVIPEGGGWGETTPENLALYQSRCFPSIEQIVDRVREVRTDFEARTGRRLDWVYVLTNGKHGWLAELAGAGMPVRVQTRHLWLTIATSRDLALTWEQRYVAQAVDMYIATRADVFIGNGFSSLTSNVVMFRMARGVDPQNTWFW